MKFIDFILSFQIVFNVYAFKTCIRLVRNSCILGKNTTSSSSKFYQNWCGQRLCQKYVSFQQKRACPDGWTQLLGSCYWLRLESSSWDEAAEVCTAMSGYLATITSQTEHDAIIGAYNSSVPNAIWIGGKYDEIEQRWNWINGEVWNYTNICSNCTFEASLNCINIKARDFDSLRFWNYRKCSVSKYALCEKEF